MRITRPRTVALLFPFLLLTLQANADAKHQIESHFQNKVFGIRGFYRDNQLVYDAQGNVKGDPHAGPWTLGLIHIERVKERSNEFRLEGKRVVSIYDRKQNRFVNTVPAKAEDVEITVKLPADQVSDSALDALTRRIFQERVTDKDVPEYWRNFFNPNLSLAAQGTATLIPTLGSKGEPVFRLGSAGPALSEPMVIARTEPKYEETARLAKLQGTTRLEAIIDKRGIPAKIQISQPLGMGLDDAAVAAVSNWRFKPAMMNGEPVAVEVSVEVEFRLY